MSDIGGIYEMSEMNASENDFDTNLDCTHRINPLCKHFFNDIQKTLKKIEYRLEKIEKVLITGNGVPSLLQRVSEIEREVNPVKEDSLQKRLMILETTNKELNKYKWLAIAAFLGVLVPKIANIFLK
jgi:uncharacterized protein Yka (UPF0111/DUF47 family)